MKRRGAENMRQGLNPQYLASFVRREINRTKRNPPLEDYGRRLAELFWEQPHGRVCYIAASRAAWMVGAYFAERYGYVWGDPEHTAATTKTQAGFLGRYIELKRERQPAY